MDNEIKKKNSAIEKAESLADAEFTQVIDPLQGMSINGGFVEPQATPILPPVQVKKHKRKGEKGVNRRNRSDKSAKEQLKAEKNLEKARLKRLKAEKRASHKKQKAEERAYLKRVKADQKHEHKQNKGNRRERQKNQRRKRGVGGWIAAVVSLGCVTLVLGSLLTVSMFTDYMEMGKVNTNSSNTQRAFYDFVGYVDNMETNMSKFFVSSDSQGQQKILTTLTVQSNLADAAISELPIKDESKYLTSKYINQVGDYAKYLNNRLIEGYSLTEEEINSMKELYKINLNRNN